MLISDDHHVWSKIEADYALSVPRKVRAIFEAHPTLVAAARGDWSGIDNVVEAIWTALEAVSDATATRSKRESRGQSPDPDDLGPIKNEHSATYVGVLSNLVFRHAQREEAELCQALRSAFASASTASWRIKLRFAGVEMAFDDFKGYEREHRLVTVEVGFGFDELPFLIDRAVRWEALRRSPLAVQGAFGDVIGRLSRIAAIAGEGSLVSEAFFVSTWSKARGKAAAGVLRYLHPRGHVVEVPYGGVGGILHALDVTSRVIGAKYRWTPEQAAVFLLCSQSPMCRVATVGFDIRTDPRTGPSGVSSIRLVVDPTLSPDDVKAIYAEARRRVLPNYKELSVKSLDLANEVFSRGLGRSGMPDDWVSMMESWNRYVALQEKVGLPVTGQKTRDAEYRKPSLFKEHCVAARDRILNPKLMDPGCRVYYPRITRANDVRRKARRVGD